jgi:protein required for attachment to host cells
MKVPNNALVALVNGERFLLMRNIGQAFEPKLQQVEELDLLLTNFSAGVRHQDPAGQRNGSTDLDELAHGAAVAEWLNDRALKGNLEDILIAADPKTLGQIRQRCHKETERRIIGELPKDLINQPVAAIERAIADA